jgi:hypothetical protein
VIGFGIWDLGLGLELGLKVMVGMRKIWVRTLGNDLEGLGR